MKFKTILVVVWALAMAVACNPMEDINRELDDSFNGFITKDAQYTLVAADYATISNNARKDALTDREIEAAQNILKGDTALTDGFNLTHLPELLAAKNTLQGYGPTSMVSVTYKFRESVAEATRDTTQRYFKRSANAWILLPEAGYAYDFENGTDYAEVAASGWAQYHTGGVEDRKFVYRSYGGNRYAQITAYASGGALTDKVDVWMVSPALNLDAVYVAKNLRFRTSNAYPNGAKLLVYVLNNQDPDKATFKEELTGAVIAGSAQNNYVFTGSGVVDLSAYSGTVYIAFRYLAQPGETTTYQVDDFEFDFLEME